MSTPLSKRLFAGMAAASLGLAVTACGGGEKAANVEFDDSVTVGILHSLTGTMAISESTLVDTEKMAIDEINAAGGVTVDGKSYEIKYIVEDGASDWPTFAEKSKKLIDQDKVPGLRWLDLRKPQGHAPGLRIQGRFPLLPDSVRGPGVFQQHFLHRCHSEPAVGACHRVHV